MKQKLLILGAVVALSGSLLAQGEMETAEQHAARMAWWHEAKFGLFIHWGVYAVPAGFYTGSPFPVEFAAVEDADKRGIRWMEEFGEWKHAIQVSRWQPASRTTLEVDVALAGDYHLEFVYKEAGRTAWRIETDEGVKLQNQQNGADVYHA